MGLFGWLQRGKKPASVHPQSRQTFIIINGRRVYVDGTSYALPNDAQENNRLDLQHFVMQYVMQRPTAIPFDGQRIPYPNSVLEIACGTGRWAAEMAYKWPHANIVATDIKKPDAYSPSILQGYQEPPPNLVIDEGDIRQPFPFADNSFDYVHARFLVVAIAAGDWPHVVHELVRVTRSGGWIELVETNMQPAVDTPAARQFFAWFGQLTAQRPYDLLAGNHIADYLKAGGAVNIKTSTLNVPIGSWGGRLGSMLETDVAAALDGLVQPIVMRGLTTQQEAQAVIAQLRQDFSLYGGKQQAVVPFTYAYGQKP